jgi:secondary thiamine-phosphate synthase enzyme
MRFIQHTLTIQTPGRKLIELTTDINKLLSSCSATEGLCNLFLAHTSASLILCENYDPDVRRDLENFMSSLVPETASYKHNAEGSDDMPAHIRTVLTQNSLSIPISKEKLILGSWQGVFLWEHRSSPHLRKLIVSIMIED